MVYQGQSPEPKLPSPVYLHSDRAHNSSDTSAGGLQLYFIVMIYNYALHLRHGTYRTLPLSRSHRGLSIAGHLPDSESEDEDTHLHDVDDFHQPYPPRMNGHGRGYSVGRERATAGEVVFDADGGSLSNANTLRASR